MKKIVNTLLPVSILFFAACGNSTEADHSHDGHNHDAAGHSHTAPADSTKQAATIQLKDDKLNAVYLQYDQLTKALINGQLAEAKIAGNAIETGAKEIPGASAIQASAGKITNATDLEAQRVAYSALSNELISLVKKSGLNSGQLYVDYCPMALNDKGGYWLSTVKEIRNPYFGDKMMSCGEVKDSIGQ
ncbi:MAG: DUF3347 domain-containing protein [Candidatus Pseudobacter hemicellulosilyticus]|uniref:DUF3347 domain-containing protein n=1 Tax=Candidatus Pseudobacter hemicellulosilyticus TaxID=3121375 RepID=A0AAJ5WSK9_9BACT|nr:MAG: DUF3347 domain-containing protein [Pseudobacter sp.]